MDILENELVRKYFGNGPCESVPGQACIISGCPNHFACMAWRVFKAMQEPMSEGTKILTWRTHQRFEESTASNSIGTEFHPGILVLPEKFQTAKQDWCMACNTQAKHLELCEAYLKVFHQMRAEGMFGKLKASEKAPSDHDDIWGAKLGTETCKKHAITGCQICSAPKCSLTGWITKCPSCGESHNFKREFPDTSWVKLDEARNEWEVIDKYMSARMNYQLPAYTVELKNRVLNGEHLHKNIEDRHHCLTCNPPPASEIRACGCKHNHPCEGHYGV